jgi:hypothetical protein
MTSTSTMKICGNSFSSDMEDKQSRDFISESQVLFTQWWRLDWSQSQSSSPTAKVCLQATSATTCSLSGGPRSVKTQLSKIWKREWLTILTVQAKILQQVISDFGCILSQKSVVVKLLKRDAPRFQRLQTAIQMTRTPKWKRYQKESKSKLTAELSSQDRALSHL